MLHQLAKLASRLDSVGLTKEADVLDAFIKRAADGDYSEVSGEYHPSAEEEEMFGKWHDESEAPDGEETEHLAPGDGNDLYHPEREDEVSSDRETLIRILDVVGADSSTVDDLSDEEVEAMVATCRDLIPR